VFVANVAVLCAALGVKAIVQAQRLAGRV
jgi:hypothetical protein